MTGYGRELIKTYCDRRENRSLHQGYVVGETCVACNEQMRDLRDAQGQVGEAFRLVWLD
jgi:hypothetical protein